jgi:hypothetical protein
VPKPARDRGLFTTTKYARDVFATRAKSVRHAEKRDGTDFWHVAIQDWTEGEEKPKAHIAVEFIIGRRDGELAISNWSISGYDMPPASRDSRLPLHTYARAALLAVDDALAVDELTHEDVMRHMNEGLPYHGTLSEAPAFVTRAFRIADGRLDDPRARNPRPRPRRTNHTVTPEERLTRATRAAEAYREAIARGSPSPTEDVARALDVSRSTASRAITDARRQGLLGRALRNRAGEQMTTRKGGRR